MVTNKPSSSKGKSHTNGRGPTQNGQSQTPGQGSSQKSGLIYDPDMDVHEVRQLRSGYRDLLSTQADTRANLSNIKVDALIDVVAQTTSMFYGVKRAAEATLDSKAMTNLSEMAALKARDLKHSAGGFDVEDFIAKLVTFMGGPDPNSAGGGVDDDDDDDMEGRGGLLDWEKFGYLALRHSRRVPGVKFMLGPLSIEQKQKTQTKRQSHKVKKDASQNVAPENVDVTDQQKSYELDTAFMVHQLNTLLQENANPNEGGINYFRFVINPHSFEQSVENIFYFAFLIKDGFAAWEISETGEPLVYACDPATQADYQNDLKRKQVIAEFDMETWERAIQVFNIKKSIIPTRKPVPPEEKYPNYTGNNRGGRGRGGSSSDEDGDGEEDVPLPSQREDDDEDE